MAATPTGVVDWIRGKIGGDLTGAEIGVAVCGHVIQMLDVPGFIKRLYAVDPWLHYAEYVNAVNGAPDVENVAQAQQDERYKAACDLAAKDGRLVVIREMSTEAAVRVNDGELDFAYIDGNHTRDFVAKDIEAWWPKIRSGGIMAGHDYCLQVKEAVDARFGDSVEEVPSGSWAVRK
ncbi:MAG TPA: class I SAM-dependent methyltransferase [Phycisphaerae bacterium]|nr:class I SAM-dependent methyltransferase [Phycisphaerae bacterium]